MRYFMHFSSEHGVIEDEEGRELADDVAARREALAGARDMMAADLRNGHLNLIACIDVEDETREPLFTVRFADAVTVNRRPGLRRPLPE